VAGQGVIPALQEVIVKDFKGFSIKEETDPGLSLTKLTTTDNGVAVLSERGWILTLERPADAMPVKEFSFPAVKLAGANITLKTYNDADLVEAPASVKLATEPRITWQAWLKENKEVILKYGALGLGGILLLVMGFFALLKRSPKAAPRHAMPNQVTPFSVISLLRRLDQDPEVQLNNKLQGELRQTIRDLEGAYFAPEETEKKLDLHSIARRWLRVARV
jgi:hypothetical protein